MPFRLTGERKLRKEINRTKMRYPSSMAATLYEKGLAIDADAVKLTPVEFGRLRASHYVAPPTGVRTDPVVQVGFGTDYALYVHEREEAYHAPPTRAKYLEVPLREHQRGYLKWIAERLRSNVKRRRGIKSIPKRAPTEPKTEGGK